MPLKDIEKRNEASKARMQKMRCNKEGVTDEGVTRIEFIKEALRIKDKDGKVLNDDLIDGIEAAAVRFNDREARFERAYRYFQWRRGEEIAPAIAYVVTEDRDRIERIVESASTFNVSKEIRYGVSGPTLDIVGEALEATR